MSRPKKPFHRLRSLRLERGLTLSETASRLGCSLSTLSRIERGFFGRMPVHLACAIEREFPGISVAEWDDARREAA